VFALDLSYVKPSMMQSAIEENPPCRWPHGQPICCNHMPSEGAEVQLTHANESHFCVAEPVSGSDAFYRYDGCGRECTDALGYRNDLYSPIVDFGMIA
jgi:hypothetical protein